MVRRLALVLSALALLVTVALLLRQGKRTADPGRPTGPQEAGRGGLADSGGAGPARPDPPAVAPGRASVDDAEIEPLLKSFLEAYRKAAREPGHAPQTRFGYEEALHLREGRLLARAYPDRVEPLLFGIASDLSRPLGDRQYATRLLGELAREGVARAEASLVQLARAVDDDTRNAAVGVLFPADREGLHRELYREGFEKGLGNAVHAVSLWPDPPAVARMRALAADPEADLRGSARMVLDFYDVLLADDAPARLERLIAVVDGDVEWWTPWALEAAAVRRLPGLKDALRKRLDENERLARARFRESYPGLPPDLAARPPFEEVYPKGDGGHAIFDPCHDQVLLAYLRAGGEPTELERRRLRHHGYLVDPRERLAEILNERR